MNKKRIFVLAYTRQNLGDDLFIYMLLEKYPHVQFYINIENKEHAKLFENFENITIYNEEKRTLTKQNANEYDAYIYIGGSIFMEGIGSKYVLSQQFLEFMKECKNKAIPFFYISSNFGPYQTKEYLELARNVYKNCTSICFRDTYSKQLFEQIPQVNYAPDLAFSYIPKQVNKIPNTVGITVIDLENRKTLTKYTKKYYDMLEKNITNYILQGKNVTLFSFCKYEGDEKVIEELLNKLNKKVNVVKYNGNIEKFLEEYSKMEYMICARFHSMVLSSIMGQKCMVMSYSKKIDNVIKDLNLFKENIIHFEKLEANTIMPLSNFKNVDSEKIQTIAQNAKKQFEQLNKYL